MDMTRPDTVISRGDRDAALISFLYGTRDKKGGGVEKEELQAICSHLSTNVSQFSSERISPSILSSLVKKSRVVEFEQDTIHRWMNGEIEVRIRAIRCVGGAEVEHLVCTRLFRIIL